MSSENLYVPDAGELEVIRATIEDAAGPLICRLYENDLPYNPNIVLGDLVEASFVGYAPFGPITWGTPFTNPDGKAQSDTNAMSWTFTGGTGTAAVYGLYFTDTGNSKLWFIMPFVPAVVLTPTQPTTSRIVSLTDASEL